jgi:signal transduction histidine kinase
MRKIYFFLLFFFTISGASAQLEPRDSLLKLLTVAPEDSNKVNLLFSISDLFESSDPGKAKQYIQMAGELSKKIDFTKGIQKFYRYISYVFVVQSQYDSVLYYNQLGLELARSKEDTFTIGVSLFNIGIAYRFKSDYENAVLYSLEGARLLEGKGYTNIEASLYDGLQVLYMTLAQYDKAIMYGEKAIFAGRKLENKGPLAVALNNLALSYMEVDRLENAKQVLMEALAISKTIDNKSVEGSALNNLGDIAIREGTFDLLKKYGEQSLQIHQQINSTEGIAISTLSLAIYYQSHKEFTKAKEYALTALKISEENNFLSEKSQCMKVLANIFFSMGDFKTGYSYSLKSQKTEGEIFNESLVQKEAVMKVRFETEKKEILIKELEADKKVQQLSIRQKNTLNYILVGSAVILLIISLLSYLNYKQKQKLQQQRISELEKEKHLTATEAVLKGEEQERTRLAKDLHDGLGGMLSGIKYSFQTMKGNLVMTPDNARAFERSMDMLDSSIKEMRRVAHNMMPEALVKFGLDTALKDFCNDINQSGAIRASYQSIGLENAVIEQTTAVTIYRIVQELINNTMKHAAAKTAIVQVSKTNGAISITVEDDGKGFNPVILQGSKGIGWNNIQSRVEYLKGKLDVQSEPGKGTSVHIELNT